MAKQHRRAAITKTENQQGRIIEEVLDDSLLPDVAEIERLYQLDPDILVWLKERAEKEQDFRQKAFNSKLDLVKRTEVGDRRINYMGLIFSFIILLAGMFLSYTMIMEKHEVLGSIFSGATLVAVISIFMGKVQSNNKKTK